SKLPHRTAEELQKYTKEYCAQYQIDNKETILERQKVYRENNKETAAEYSVEYRKNNKEGLFKYHKEYCENNKESIAEYQKQYAMNNSERIKAHKSEVHLCDCGKNYTLGHKSRHERTKKHIAYVDSCLVTEELNV
ncbi:MAG: hypothetical protein HOI47_30985, partial [Candidatus Scalindua sp.]|nr:hypothetical protein [Candidatus Scalindua sp.]